MNSIYSSIEAEAWSRGFNYAEYRNLQSKERLRLMISEKTYMLLCAAFKNQSEEDKQHG